MRLETGVAVAGDLGHYDVVSIGGRRIQPLVEHLTRGTGLMKLDDRAEALVFDQNKTDRRESTLRGINRLGGLFDRFLLGREHNENYRL